MTPETERRLKTLAYAWILGVCAGAFLGWLLVPAVLSVDYLTAVVVTCPFVGLIAGGALVGRSRGTATSR